MALVLDVLLDLRSTPPALSLSLLVVVVVEASSRFDTKNAAFG